MSFSLIIPAAADTEESQTEMPFIFLALTTKESCFVSGYYGLAFV